MSSSVAPSARACRASNDLGRGRVAAVREADDRADRDVRAVEDRRGTARHRPAGRRPTRRRTRPPAGSPPRRTRRRAPAAGGEWSIALAMSRSVSESMSRSRAVMHWHSLDVGAEDVAGDEEATLDELVGPLEVAVLVLDDHVAVVAGAPQGAEQRCPSRPRRARAGAGSASPCPIEKMPARRGPRDRS